MENTIRDRFVFTYESGVTGSFLVANISKDDSIVEFQVNMLANNPNKHIIPLDVRRNNNRISLYYNVTSKLSLSQYLSRSRLSKIEFVEIFSGIVKTLLNSKGLFLSENSFLLDDEYVYISPDTMCISLIYLPVKLEIDITKALKDFAINFVVYSANINEENSDSFLQQFLSFLKKDNFNIIDFDKFLKEMKRVLGKQMETDSDKPEVSNKANEIPQAEHTSANTGLQEQNEINYKQNKPKVDIPKAKGVQDRNLKKDNPPNNRQVKELKSTNVQSGNALESLLSKPNILIGASIQAVMVLIVFVLLFSGKLDSLGNDKVSTVFGLLLVIAAASYFMWKNVMKIKIVSERSTNKPVVPKRQENKARNNAPSPKIVERPSKDSKLNVQTKILEVKKDNIKENKRPDINSHSPKVIEKPYQREVVRQPVGDLKPMPIKISSNVNETVLLGSSDLRHPHLQIYTDTGVEEVVINKPSFIIGRLEGQVDYVHSNNAIGKVHAEIITREGHYYLKDINSKNGTYINGKRIDSNIEYEIQNNDKITLANSEFLFIVM
ncbi:MAG: FHA domain-containing protein [Clostridiaceae bacterium]|jgi:hypothetical protein|nr:FHA domain-containing protein [Clostridiaceae bacterium]